MGVGRFVYTPILPLMHAQAGLSAGSGADLATANYIGYLVGALVGILAPALVRSPVLLRASLIALTGSLAAMPATHGTAVWIVLRLLAGVASALIFVIAVSSLHSHLREHPAHLPGWAFGGVGAGIALSGLLALALRSVADWRAAWWASAALAAVLTLASWNLRPEPAPAATAERGRTAVDGPRIRTHRWFGVLFASYSLEGIGYIVAVGIALPALVGGVAAALGSAVLFGATFIGVSNLALAAGAHLRFPRSVALLTAGYSVGQILGPLAVAPLLRHGCHQALILAAAVVLAAAAAAAVLRIGFPNRVGER
ncbi:YbfB/YjiJ family MFS transporter [Streptomyces sp. NPDC059679]|uniref:YbfB/YjiJ family MFS transporter n=1 Tax=Streptomyces sp. NPDC059679 TaxID=3346903 RepID=UPI0036BCD978